MRHVLLVLILSLVPLKALAENRVALIIGNSNYISVGSLDNPQNDALDISVALKGLGFEVILGLDLTRARMQLAAEEFSQLARTADVALFFYAGHGFQVDGRNYLVPTDAALSTAADVAKQTVPIEDILRTMANAPGIKLIFLDACRDNPFGASLGNDAGVGSSLARVGTDADFLFAYATQPDNVAYDGTGRNSFFTEAMLHHIYTPGQDIADLMISVRRDVLAATGGRQIPWENSSLTRQFVFDISPPTVSEEALFYQVAASVEDPALLSLYVESFPEGAHVNDAMSFLESRKATRALELVDPADQEERLWALARRSRMRPLLQFYLDRFPDGGNAAEARR